MHTTDSSVVPSAEKIWEDSDNQLSPLAHTSPSLSLPWHTPSRTPGPHNTKVKKQDSGRHKRVFLATFQSKWVPVRLRNAQHLFCKIQWLTRSCTSQANSSVSGKPLRCFYQLKLASVSKPVSASCSCYCDYVTWLNITYTDEKWVWKNCSKVSCFRTLNKESNLLKQNRTYCQTWCGWVSHKTPTRKYTSVFF